MTISARQVYPPSVPKERSPGQTAVSISIPSDALAKIDARAAQRSLSRSAYLKLLALQDSALPGSVSPQPMDLTDEIYDFLLIAVPALQEYAAKKGEAEPPTVPPAEPSDELAETKLWKFFLLEMDEILRHKFLRSKELDYDIGLSRAIKEWLQQHRLLWAASHKPED